jgi:membrane associated rhomboid family serine protease
VAFCLNAGSGVEYFDSDGNPLAPEYVERELGRRMAEGAAEAVAYLESLDVREKGGGAFQWLSLEFGRIRPWQWLTNNFNHADWGHLIGNMVFLWAFGLVVEGKVGNLAFVAIYLGIGAVYGMLLQLGAYFFVDGGMALGASAAIFGLLALCTVWAPANEFSCIILYWVRDIPIIIFAFLYLALQVFFWSVTGFQVSSELLHILGFAVGFPVGVWLLRTGRVDCEGWDLFSYMSGTTGRDSRMSAQRLKAKRARKSRAPSSTEHAAPAPAVSTDKLQDQ